MKIIVKTLSGNVFNLDVEPTDTVRICTDAWLDSINQREDPWIKIIWSGTIKIVKKRSITWW